MIKEWKLPPELGGHPVNMTARAPGMPGWYVVRIPGMCFDIMVQGECLVAQTPPQPAKRSLVVCQRGGSPPSFFQRLLDSPPGGAVWFGIELGERPALTWTQLHSQWQEVTVLVDAGADSLEDTSIHLRSFSGTPISLERDESGDLYLTVGGKQVLITSDVAMTIAAGILGDLLGRS